MEEEHKMFEDWWNRAFAVGDESDAGYLVRKGAEYKVNETNIMWLAWKAKGEAVKEAMQLALYALEEVTFFVGPQDVPAKVEGTYSDAVDCNMAINALRKFVVPNAGTTNIKRFFRSR